MRLADALCWIGIHSPKKRAVMGYYVTYCRRCQMPETLGKIQKFEAFSDGAQAFKAGEPETANPHDAVSFRCLHDEWALGWYEAYADDQERRQC
jgi:hypothetical protein